MSEDPELMIKEQELQEKIEKFVEEEIQPYINQDGGHLQVLQFSIRSGVLRIQMQGACSTCPSSMMTLKFGVERRIMEVFPEVTAVEAQNPPSLLDAVEE